MGIDKYGQTFLGENLGVIIPVNWYAKITSERFMSNW